jgi:hypothetical protein
MGVFKWIFGLLLLACYFYGMYILLNERISQRRSVADCRYHDGRCSVSVTALNCSGGMLDSFCEKELNGIH